MNDPTTPETPPEPSSLAFTYSADATVPPEPVTIHTLAATVAKFKALKEAANKAMDEAQFAYNKAVRDHNEHRISLAEARKSLADFAELLDAGLSTAPTEPVETFSGAGAKA